MLQGRGVLLQSDLIQLQNNAMAFHQKVFACKSLRVCTALRGVPNPEQMHKRPSAEAIYWKRGGLLRRFSVIAQDRFVIPPRDDVLRSWFSVGPVAFEGACSIKRQGVYSIARRAQSRTDAQTAIRRSNLVEKGNQAKKGFGSVKIELRGTVVKAQGCHGEADL